MSDICKVCGKSHYSWIYHNGKGMCTDCANRLEREEILNKATESDSARFFKDWNSRDRTTAFFECFGRYVKEPNARDFKTIYHIWLWACHDDAALVRSIEYTFKWAKMSVHGEYIKWKKGVLNDSTRND